MGRLLVEGLYTAGALAFLSIYLARTDQSGLRRRPFIVDRGLSSLPRAEGTGDPATTGAAMLEVECQRL